MFLQAYHFSFYVDFVNFVPKIKKDFTFKGESCIIGVERTVTLLKLPQHLTDLRRFVIRRRILRIGGSILFTAAWISGAVMYNYNHQTYPPYRRIIGWKMLLWIIAGMVIAAFLFKLPQMLSDRTRVGTVRYSGLSHSYTSSPDAAGTRAYDFRTNTALSLQLDNGKRSRLRFEQKNGFYMYYREGERLVKFAGLPYPINLDPDATHGCICAACGRWGAKKAPRCEACGLSLIDVKDLKEDEA